ncbi:MAG: radical SAM protein [Candidatus Muiribacteriota bacterium]
MSFFELDLLQLGITNKCNNKCIMCHQSKDWYNPDSQGYMNFNEARKIIDNLYENKIRFKVLHLFWKGEPFCNPDFMPILKYFLKSNEKTSLFENLYINTNGSLLSGKEEEFIEILNMNPEVKITLNISIDAAYSETYKKIRRTDSLYKIDNSLKKLIYLREKNSLKNPVFVCQIVIQDKNSDDIDDFVNKWKTEFEKYNKKVNFTYYIKNFEKDTIFFRPLQPETEISRKLWLDTLKKYIPDEWQKLNEVHIARIHANERKKADKPCFHLWKTPIIDWNGKITACCGDFNCQLLNQLSNTKDKFFSDIWFGDYMEDLRLKSYFGRYDEMPSICSSCFMYLEITPEFRHFLEKWAKKRKLPVLYPTDYSDSEDIDEIINIANSEIVEGNFDKALVFLEKAKQINSQNEKLNSAFVSLYVKTEKYKNVLHFAEFLYKKTKKIKYLEDIAFAHFNLKNYDEAHKFYRLLFKKNKKEEFFIKLLEVEHKRKNTQKVKLYLRFSKIFNGFISEVLFLRLIDFFYTDEVSLNLKDFKNLSAIAANLKKEISCEHFKKFFYIKRKKSFFNEVSFYNKTLKKNIKCVDENMIIEWVLFEIENHNLNKFYIREILEEFILDEGEFALEVLKKLSFSKNNIVESLNQIEKNGGKIREVILKFLKSNKMFFKFLIYKLKTLSKKN